MGAIWLGHNAITDYLDRADVTLLRLNLLLLLFVSFLPFPTRLLSEDVTTDRAEQVAVTFYGLTLLIAGALLSLFWRYALHARLVRPGAKDEEITLLTHRLTPGRHLRWSRLGTAGRARSTMCGPCWPVLPACTARPCRT